MCIGLLRGKLKVLFLNFPRIVFQPRQAHSTYRGAGGCVSTSPVLQDLPGVFLSGLEVPRQQGEEFTMSGKAGPPVVVPADSEKRGSRCPYQPAFLAGTVAESDQS